MKKRFTILIAAIAAIMMITQSFTAIGQTRSAETYTFTDKDWRATNSSSATANWTSGANGNGFTSGQGIQVTTGTSGANGTSPVSFSNISQIVVTYNTNKSAGAGSVVVQIGTNTEKTNSVAYSGSGDGRTANYTTTFSYATPQSGDVKITVNTTTNSIWLKSVAITYTSDPTITIGSPTGGTISVKKTSDMSNISTGTIASGTGITLNATPNTGYAFTTWNVTKTSDGTAVSLNSTATVASNSFSMPSYNTTVNATFTKQSYNVTLGSPVDADLSATDMGEISISEGETKAVPYGTELVLEADMESGKMFSWKVTKTGVTPEVDVTSTVLSGITATDAVLTVPDYAVTVSGIVQDLKYIVTYKANGGVGSDVVEYYSPGANVTVADNAFTYSGHVFKNWNTKDDGEGTDYAEGATISGIAADVTLYAQWADAWTVTLNSNGSTTTTEIEKTQSITLSSPASVPSGFVYKGWTGTPETPFNMVSTTYTPTANVTLYAVFAKTVQEYTEKTTLLHGSILKTGDDITSSITKTSDGISYTLVPSSSNKIKRMAVPNTASDEFPGVDSTILIGKEGAYIKNNTPFGEGITKFEIYQNGGASTKVTVGVYFKTTTIDAYVAYNSSTNINSWEGGLSTLDEVYDASSALYNASSELIGAKYFWYQVTNANNSQIAFRIKYIAPVYYTRVFQDETLTAATTINGPSIIPSGKTLNAGSYLTNTNAANLVIADGGQLITANNASVNATVKKSVLAWNDTNKEGWNAISSPVNGQSFSDVANLQPTGDKTHNIYLYDPANVRWQEYRNNETGVTPYTAFTNGRGYLYRKNNNTTIEFSGALNTGNVTYSSIYYDKDDVLKQYNLIGNPYAHNITKGSSSANILNGDILESKYCIFNSDGTWTLTNDGTAIAPGTAILVQAKKSGSITITNAAGSKGETANNDNIWFTVAGNEFKDVACVEFKNGHGFNKIAHRNEDAPMLYINHNGENFASVDMDDETKVINLCFKSNKMGLYTLTYNAKGVFSYLHLIDKITGEDVDMLIDDEYTFVGTSSDKEDRFIVKLAYLPDYGIDGSDTFAFQSGNEIFVSGQGELQIFDVTGRFVMSERINGATSISADALSTGVYILRIVGSEIKTQKIVVR